MMRKPSPAQKLLVGQLKRSPALTAALVALVALVTVASLLPPLLLRRILDTQLAVGDTSRLPLLAGLFFGAYALIGALDFGKAYLLNVAGQRIVRSLRSAMAAKLERLPAAYFTRNAAGSIASRFLNDVEAVDTLFSDGVVSMAIDCCKLAGALGSIWVFSARLGAFATLLLPLIALLTAFFRRRLLSAQKRNLEELSRVNRHIAETLRNLRMLKGFRKEAYMERRCEDVLTENYTTMDHVNRYDACYSPLIQIVTAVAVSTVLLLACDGGNALGVTIGTLAASITLVSSLFEPVDSLGTELQSIQSGMAGIRGVDAFLSEAEDERHDTALSLDALRRTGATLRFENVGFAYDNDKPILQGFELEVRPGERVCLIGRTGAGKTTIFRLITGLLQPTEGRVTLGGVDVRELPASQRRAVFGYVQQRFAFVRGDVAEQLSLGDPAITMDKIEAAMRFVGLHEHVASLPDGYRTYAGNGEVFSQGQKQLLCIARAIVGDPCVLLLDEVTASLDSATETAVVSVLKRLGREKTVLSIAHRASSMLDADRLVLVRDGRAEVVGAPPDASV